MEEIELKLSLKIILKRWWIILLFTVFTLILGAIYTFFIAKPLYMSDTSIYIGKSARSDSIAMMYDDVMLNDRLVKDYSELVKSRLIADEVIKELNLNDITYEKLADKLNVTSKVDTHLIAIEATDTNPQTAKNIADKVAEVFQKRVVAIMKVENIQIIDRAYVPERPVKPNILINMLISFLIGFLIGLIVVVLIEFFDDTLKTPEDVIKHLDLPVIGTIPVFPELWVYLQYENNSKQA